MTSHATVSLSLPATSTIHEVVLRGPRSDSERDLRMRAVIYLRRQVRCPQILMRPQSHAPDVSVWLSDWQNPAADALSFDRLLNSVAKTGPFRLVLCSKDWLAGSQAALEVLNRYQPMLPIDSQEELPELREASEDAVDLWRWILRLKPNASSSVQRAALSGDEAALRRDQSSGGLSLLRDAADVSFFSRSSWHYLRAWGAEQTQCTVERRLGRMSEMAICCALATRQPRAISRMIDAYLDLRSSRCLRRLA